MDPRTEWERLPETEPQPRPVAPAWQEATSDRIGEALGVAVNFLIDAERESDYPRAHMNGLIAHALVVLDASRPLWQSDPHARAIVRGVVGGA